MAPPKPVSTRVLLLFELHERAHAKLRPLASRLGITVQAVSVFLRRLQAEQLIERRDGVWRPTQQGTDALHRTMRDLHRFAEDALGNLRVIDECLAEADGSIRAGDRVGLYMRDGRLRAAPRVYAGSTGRARSAATRGRLVRIADLRGIVALQPGDFTLVSHEVDPPAASLRRARSVLAKAKRGGRLAAHDLPSALLLGRLGRAPDFEFAPLEAALDAARRGLPIQYWAPASAVPEILVALAKKNGDGPSRVRSVEL